MGKGSPVLMGGEPTAAGGASTCGDTLPLASTLSADTGGDYLDIEPMQASGAVQPTNTSRYTLCRPFPNPSTSIFHHHP